MIARYTDDLKCKWDELHGKMYNSTFMSKRDFVEYHKDRFSDHSTIIESDGKNALFPANEKNGVIYSHGGLSYGGLLIEKGAKLPTVLKMFGELVDYYKSMELKKIIYKQTPIIYCDGHQGAENYTLQLLGAKLFRRDSNVVVEEPVLSERKRRNIKKSEKAGVIVRGLSGDEDYRQYWGDILIPCLKGKHEVSPTHSIEEILRLKSFFPNNILLDAAFIDGKMIGGVVFFKQYDLWHSQYIASTSDCTKVGGLDHLFWEFIKKHNPHTLSFGVCNEEQGKVLNIGLNNWKSEFGGEIVTHDYYEIDLTSEFKDLKRNIPNV